MAEPIDLTGPNDPDWIGENDYLERMRGMRNILLGKTDWTQTADDPTGQQAAWAAYRQQLRDAPANWTPASTWTPPDPPA